MDTGTKIRRLRENKRWTRKELANVTNTTEYTIRNYENGVSQNPGSKQLSKIASIFSIPVEYLTDDEWECYPLGNGEIFWGNVPSQVELDRMTERLFGKPSTRADIDKDLDKLSPLGVRIAAASVHGLTQVPDLLKEEEPPGDTTDDTPPWEE